jgi:hypothetical protein
MAKSTIGDDGTVMIAIADRNSVPHFASGGRQ